MDIRRGFVAILALTLVAGVIGGCTLFGGGSATVDPSGIRIVGDDPVQFRPGSEDEAMFFDAALRLAMEHRADMGYPWLDGSSKTIRLSPTTAAGQAIVQADGSIVTPAGWTLTAPLGGASIAQLDQIQDDATRLNVPDVPNGNLVWMTFPDQLHNRVVITVDHLDPALMATLAERFGTELIEVRVEPIGSSGY
jgi:hypothetical protein